MLVHTVTANYLELELELEDRAYFEVLHAVGAKSQGICKLSVIIVREGLTDEICYKNFQERGARLAEDLASQEGLFGRNP